MQIQNYNQPNYNSNPNFTALKDIRCEGLYKKFPKYAQYLMDTFRQNKKAKEFFQKYDGEVVFYANEQGNQAISSSMHLFYDDPTVKGVRKILKSLFGSRDKIELSSFDNSFNVKDGIRNNTDRLVEYFTSRNGTLDAHIKTVEEKLAEKIGAVEAEKATKEAAKAQKQAELLQHKSDSEKLEQMQKELMEEFNRK